MSETFEALGELATYEPARPKLFQFETGQWLNLDHVAAAHGGEDGGVSYLTIQMSWGSTVFTEDPEVITRFFEQWEMV